MSPSIGLDSGQNERLHWSLLGYMVFIPSILPHSVFSYLYPVQRYLSVLQLLLCAKCGHS